MLLENSLKSISGLLKIVSLFSSCENDFNDKRTIKKSNIVLFMNYLKIKNLV